MQQHDEQSDLQSLPLPAWEAPELVKSDVAAATLFTSGSGPDATSLS